MNKEVTGQAFAVVCKTAPAEEPGGIKWSLRRAVQKGVPVDRLFVCVWWNRVDPSTASGVAVRIRLNHEYFTESSRVINFLRFSIEDGTDPLAADLDDAICLLSRFDHGESILHGMGHRFFAINVLAGGAGIGNHFAMLVVCCRDNDRVDVLAVEDFSMVACGRDVLLDSFPSCFMSCVVKVAYGYALDAWHAKRCLKQFATSDPRANGGKAHGVAWRNPTGVNGQQVGFQYCKFRGSGGRDSPCANTYELASIQRFPAHKTLPPNISIRRFPEGALHLPLLFLGRDYPMKSRGCGLIGEANVNSRLA